MGTFPETSPFEVISYVILTLNAVKGKNLSFLRFFVGLCPPQNDNQV